MEYVQAFFFFSILERLKTAALDKPSFIIFICNLLQLPSIAMEILEFFFEMVNWYHTHERLQSMNNLKLNKIIEFV